MEMLSRRLILASIGVFLGASVFVACVLGFVAAAPLVLVGLVPDRFLQESSTLCLVIEGVAAAFFIAVGVVAWKRKSTVLTATFCSLILASSVAICLRVPHIAEEIARASVGR